MIRLPIIFEDTSHATALNISRGQLHLEPVRILDGRWCVRRDGRLVPADPDEFDAFVMSDKTVTDGATEWKRLSRYLVDHGLVVPGDRDSIGDALRAGHWGQYRVPVERYQGRGSDTGVSATLARGSSSPAQHRRAA